MEVVVISDSDDEEEQQLPPRKRPRLSGTAPAAAKHQAKAQPARRSSQPEPEPARRGALLFQPSSQDDGGEVIRLSSVSPLQDRRAAPRPSMPPDGELWSAKHAPQSEADLIVAKKKLHELRDFLSSEDAPRLLLLTGPPGCGKSTAVRVLAAELGLEAVEWVPPVPTLWSEHLHQAGPGLEYVSKIDAFAVFVARAKLAPLALAGPGASGGKTGETGQQKLILVDDLPHVAGADQKQRMLALLETLARTPGARVVVTLTESNERRSANAGWAPLLTDLRAALADNGVAELFLNKVTAAAAVKALNRIAEAEGLALEPADAAALAEGSGGDLLNAIESLQLLASGRAGRGAARGKPKGKRKAPARKKGGAKAEPSRAVAVMQRDLALSNFHALGKLLYNKREGEAPASQPQQQQSQSQQQQGGPQLRPEYRRPAMPCSPEAVLDASGLEPAGAAAFLHENLPHFVADAAVEDFAAAADYLTDADRLLSRAAWREPSTDRAALAMEGLGAAVAARGLMWANAHPAPKRWLPLKGPLWFAVASARQLNVAHLLQTRGSQPASWSGAASLAADTLPFARILAFLRSPAADALLPRQWAGLQNGKPRVQQQQQGGQQQLADPEDGEELAEDPISDDGL